MKMLKSRKGSYLVEATILYPFVISVAVMIFVLFVVYFENTHYLYEMSHLSRVQSSKAVGTVIYGMDTNTRASGSYTFKQKTSVTSKSVIASFKRTIKDDLLYRFKAWQAFSIKHDEFIEAKVIWGMRLLTGP